MFVHSRAATNVRTFEYYSFEIFTNELFFTNERSLTPVGLFLAHTLRSEASAAASRVGTVHEWRYSCHLKSCVDACQRRSAEKEAVT